MKRHGGRVSVSDKMILHWLDFGGGKLHHVGRAEYFMDTIIFVIEHPDMPEVSEGEELTDVDVTYRFNDYERINPPKHNPLMRLLRKFL